MPAGAGQHLVDLLAEAGRFLLGQLGHDQQERPPPPPALRQLCGRTNDRFDDRLHVDGTADCAGDRLIEGDIEDAHR